MTAQTVRTLADAARVASLRSTAFGGGPMWLLHLVDTAAHASDTWFSDHATATLRPTNRTSHGRRLWRALAAAFAGLLALVLIAALLPLVIPGRAGLLISLAMLAGICLVMIAAIVKMMPGAWRNRGLGGRAGRIASDTGRPVYTLTNMAATPRRAGHGAALLTEVTAELPGESIIIGAIRPGAEGFYDTISGGRAHPDDDNPRFQRFTTPAENGATP